jgi:hypothetical protein
LAAEETSGLAVSNGSGEPWRRRREIVEFRSESQKLKEEHTTNSKYYDEEEQYSERGT